MQKFLGYSCFVQMKTYATLFITIHKVLTPYQTAPASLFPASLVYLSFL